MGSQFFNCSSFRSALSWRLTIWVAFVWIGCSSTDPILQGVPDGFLIFFIILVQYSSSGMKTSTFIRLATALLAMVAAYILGHWFFFDLPFTTDENSYVFQAHNFLEGHVARRMPPVPWAFFHPMIICDEQVGWLSRYPPAHSLWLAPGVLIGNARLMSALAAGLSVWLITGCALLLNIPALLISLLLLASP
ncbi:MAG: hypothetical protein KKD76_05400, partial [Verrucomicrobia bacterium]|nr:hypothetical protein [Verrucomicrobiota bacterium]